jgi:hypothetical protein
MKILPPAPSQLELIPRRRDLAPFVVEPSVRHEILRAVAEILLVAAESGEQNEGRDEAR